MALPSTPPIDLRMIADEIGLEGTVDLLQCLDASYLEDKSLPVDMLRFLGYSHLQVPDAITSPSAVLSGNKNGGIRLTWTNPIGGSTHEYTRIEVSENGGAFTTLDTVPASTQMYTYRTGLISSNEYSYRFYATNSAGDSPVSDTTTPIVFPELPGAITISTIANKYPNGMDVNWTDLITGGTPTSYSIILYDSSNTYVYDMGAIPPTNSVTFGHSHLTENQSYYARITAGNAAGGSPSKDTPTRIYENIPLEAPLPPKTFNTVKYRAPAGTNGLELAWSNPSSSSDPWDGFYLQYRKQDDGQLSWGPWTLIQTTVNTDATIPHSFFVAQESNTSWQFRVAAFNSAGVSTYTQWSGTFIYY